MTLNLILPLVLGAISTLSPMCVRWECRHDCASVVLCVKVAEYRFLYGDSSEDYCCGALSKCLVIRVILILS